VAQQPGGWYGQRPPRTVVVAQSGDPVESPLADGHRFELSISETPTGFRLVIVDWADESSVESEHATLDAAREHAANAVADRSLNWDEWTPPEGESV
jgi:hypothetical protein